MSRIAPYRRPHYAPLERMAILELRAARGWTAVRTAERFLLTPASIASWMQRLDEEGPEALVQIREPVNKFPDFVAYVVRRLKVLCPSMGKARPCRPHGAVGRERSVPPKSVPVCDCAGGLARGDRASICRCDQRHLLSGRG
jgi:hypothetical protein